MTDLEKLQNTLTEIGCEFKLEAPEVDADGTIGYGNNRTKADTCVSVDAGVGYSEGFFRCEFYFLKGKFQAHGCWE